MVEGEELMQKKYSKVLKLLVQETFCYDNKSLTWSLEVFGSWVL